MTQPAAPTATLNDADCGLWCVLAIVILVSVHRYMNQPPAPLLDLPHERSHPQWKSSSNLCQRSNLTTATRA